MNHLPDEQLRRMLKQRIYKMEQDIEAIKALLKEIKWSSQNERV